MLVVAALLPSSASALTSPMSSSSSESTSNDNYACLKVTLATVTLKGDRGLTAAALTSAAAALILVDGRWEMLLNKMASSRYFGTMQSNTMFCGEITLDSVPDCGVELSFHC